MRIAYCLNFGTFSNSTSTIPFNSEQSLIDKEIWKKKKQINKRTLIWSLHYTIVWVMILKLKQKNQNDIPDTVVSNLNVTLNGKCLLKQRTQICALV